MQLQPLLNTPPPYADESFMGYITRVAEQNYYDSPVWIFQLVGLRPQYEPRGDLPIAKPASFEALSQLVKVDKETLKSMLPFDSLHTLRPKLKDSSICPECLREKPYYRTLWHLPILQKCSKRKCLLVSECPACGKQLSLFRRSIVRCNCGFDLRECRTITAREGELKLSNFVYMHWKQAKKDEVSLQVSPSEKLELSLKRFSNLLMFILQELREIQRRGIERPFRIYRDHDYWRELDDITAKLFTFTLEIESAFSILSNPANFYSFVVAYNLGRNNHAGPEKVYSFYRLLPVLTLYQRLIRYFYSEIYCISGKKFENSLVRFLRYKKTEAVIIEWYTKNSGEVLLLKEATPLKHINSLVHKIAEDLELEDLSLLDILINTKLSKDKNDVLSRTIYLTAPLPCWLEGNAISEGG